MLKNAACSVAYVFYQLQTKRFTPDSQDPTCTRSHQAFRSWWFALWVEWQHQKLHTHTHTRSFPGCQKSLTKYTARLITRLMQHEHAAVHLAGNAAAVMKTSPHLHLHLRWLSSLFVSRSSPPRWNGRKKRVQVRRVKSDFDVCFWTLEQYFSPRDWRCGHLNKAGKKNKWRSAYFRVEEKQEALNVECQQFKEVQGRWTHTHTHTHMRTCTHSMSFTLNKQEASWTLTRLCSLLLRLPLALHTHIRVSNNPGRPVWASHCCVTYTHTHTHASPVSAAYNW